MKFRQSERTPYQVTAVREHPAIQLLDRLLPVPFPALQHGSKANHTDDSEDYPRVATLLIALLDVGAGNEKGPAVETTGPNSFTFDLRTFQRSIRSA